LEALLDISGLNAGAIVPILDQFSVSKLLATLETNYAPAARLKGLAFRIVPCRALLRSDPVLLKRILFNLVSNAVRYTRKGKILVGCRRRGSHLRIEVWDTGVGISEDQQRPIFEEFHRVAGHEQEAERGHGLGLAIVDRLARLLGHAIELRSTPGKGSMFAVAVPLATEETAKKDEVAKTARAGVSMENARVMVLDDDPAALKATQTLLQSWGCRVLTAASGDEAVSCCSAAPRQLPDIVICDYRLAGGETGVQVINRLQTAFPGSMQFILVSGDTSAEVARCAQEWGLPLLRKPVRPAKLRALLDHCLRARPR